MERYQNLGKLGEGAFGEVFKAKRLRDGKAVALKKVRIRNPADGLSKNLMRELQALQQIDHTHVVQLLDHFACGSAVVMVMELMLTDLYEVTQTLSSKGQAFSQAAIKCIVLMMLQAVAGVHESGVLHRDVKPSNLLFSPKGTLKLGDFGLARVKERKREVDYSHEVATRWYRAPELLYGARNYDESVDMWAVGCIVCELFNRCPVFPGENDIDQLYRVQVVLGTPTVANCPNLHSLPDYNKIQFPELLGRPLGEVVAEAPPDALAFIKRFMKYNAKDRATAQEALRDSYFLSDPLPLHPHELLPLITQQTRRLSPSETEQRASLLDVDLHRPICF